MGCCGRKKLSKTNLHNQQTLSRTSCCGRKSTNALSRISCCGRNNIVKNISSQSANIVKNKSSQSEKLYSSSTTKTLLRNFCRGENHHSCQTFARNLFPFLFQNTQQLPTGDETNTQKFRQLFFIFFSLKTKLPNITEAGFRKKIY